MIKVGVFWVSALFNIDVIYDIETYPCDVDTKEILLTYSKQHKDVWGNLSQEQLNGKYHCYQYNFLPRGRLSYDTEEKEYKLMFYRGSKDFMDLVSPKILTLFGIEKAKISNVGE